MIVRVVRVMVLGSVLPLAACALKPYRAPETRQAALVNADPALVVQQALGISRRAGALYLARLPLKHGDRRASACHPRAVSFLPASR